jgi:hypothetical protein
MSLAGWLALIAVFMGFAALVLLVIAGIIDKIEGE